jgi:hypothetical protein
LEEPLSVRFENCDNEVGFGWKVMMNTGFANLDCVGDIGVAEGGVAEIGDHGFCGLEDAVCGFSLHAYLTTY